MIAFALLSLLLFGLLALGWVATRRRPATPAALKALTLFSYRFALPALAFFGARGAGPLAMAIITALAHDGVAIHPTTKP